MTRVEKIPDNIILLDQFRKRGHPTRSPSTWEIDGSQGWPLTTVNAIAKTFAIGGPITTNPDQIWLPLPVPNRLPGGTTRTALLTLDRNVGSSNRPRASFSYGDTAFVKIAMAVDQVVLDTDRVILSSSGKVFDHELRIKPSGDTVATVSLKGRSISERTHPAASALQNLQNTEDIARVLETVKTEFTNGWFTFHLREQKGKQKAALPILTLNPKGDSESYLPLCSATYFSGDPFGGMSIKLQGIQVIASGLREIAMYGSGRLITLSFFLNSDGQATLKLNPTSEARERHAKFLRQSSKMRKWRPQM